MVFENFIKELKKNWDRKLKGLLRTTFLDLKKLFTEKPYMI